MFSGLVVAQGEVAGLHAQGRGVRLDVLGQLPGEPLARGESIAVQGVCLTVTGMSPTGFSVDVSAETGRRTTLTRLRCRSRVNLERSVRLSDRLGGHLVLGHVDATAAVLSVRPGAPFATLRIELPRQLELEVAEKGSVAVDGVSLTVAAVGESFFEAELVPETLRATTLGECRPGDRVNLETDVLAKYVRRCLHGKRPDFAKLLEGLADATY